MKKEAAIQRAVCAHLRQRGVPGLLWFHVPNAPRSARAGAELKRQGMLAGVSDLLLLHGEKFYALELKDLRGRPTEAQLDFVMRVQDAGGHSAIAYGLDKALATLKTWGLLK